MSSLYIFGQISTQQELEKRRLSSDPAQGFLDALATNYTGGDVTDIAYYQTTQEEEDRISIDSDYTLVWTDGQITGLDFSIEFAKQWLRFSCSDIGIKANAPSDLEIENISIWTAETYSQNDYVYHNGAIWQCVVANSTTSEPAVDNSDWSRICAAAELTVELLKPDKSGVVAGYNKSNNIPVTTNTLDSFLRINFQSGVGKAILFFGSVQDCGTWKFPSSDIRELIDGTDIRIDQQVELEVILPY